MGRKRILVCSDNGLGDRITRCLRGIAPVDKIRPGAMRQLSLKPYGAIVLNLQPATERYAQELVAKARERGARCPIITFRNCEAEIEEEGKDPFDALAALVRRRF